MRDQNKKITIYTILYTAGIICFFLANVLLLTYAGDWWEANAWRRRLRLASYALAFGPCVPEALLLAIRGIRERHLPWELPVCAVMLGLSAVTSWKLGSANPLLYIFLALAPMLLKVPMKRVLPVFAAVQILTVTALYLLSAQDVILYQYGSRADGTLRHFFGFTHTTHGPIILLFSGMLLILYLKERGRLIALPVFFLIEALLFRYCNARVCFFISAAFTLGTWLLTVFPKLGKLSTRLSPLVLPLSVVFSMVSPFLVKGTAMTSDTFLNRLQLARQALEEWPVTLFGQKITWVGHFGVESGRGTYNFVDNHYVSVLLEYGVFYLLMVLLIYGAVILYSRRRELAMMNMIAMLVLVFAIMEPRLWEMTFNAVPLLFGEAMTGLAEDRRERKRKQAGVPEEANSP